jgi:hypothetical protein
LAGLKWTVDLAIGGLLWLVVPQWLATGREAKLRWIGAALVTGAVAAALVGFLEFLLGMSFAESLTMFKAKPTVAGPYLRLSATFEYANIAAMYFELVFPFAVVGLLGALGEAQAHTIRVVLWLAASMVLFEAILLTYSRGALIGLSLCLLTLVVLVRHQGGFARIPRPRRWVVWAAVGIGLVLTAWTFSAGSLAALRLSSQSDQDWYRAAYTGSPPSRMAVCQIVSVPVTVANLSPLTWQARGAQSYHLGYHWLYTPTRVAQFEGLRSALRADVAPGRTGTVLAQVRAPRTPGRYLLVWDMVQENVSWFSLKSATYSRIPVEVTGLPPNRRAAACHGGPMLPPNRHSSPTALPTVLSEPNRGQLWGAALAMVRKHPLLGVGPDGFRLSYGSYATPPQVNWDQRILANSLYLEIVADLGLVGGVLFFAFIAAAAWPLVREVRGQRGWDPWQVALIGALAAFFGHGLVDYNLESHAIFILFWLLLALMAAGPECERRDTALGGI